MRDNPPGETSSRAISTVLDASLCLLLVGASAATLAATPTLGEHATVGPTSTVGPDTADETADLLTASTARVSYETGSASEASATEPARNRTVHDTLAGLLASAARADAESASARRSADAPTPFVRAVTARVGRALRRPDVGVQVVARLPASASNATRDGRVVAGTAPPPDRDVHAAGFAVRGIEFTVRTWSR